MHVLHGQHFGLVGPAGRQQLVEQHALAVGVDARAANYDAE